MCCHVLPEQFVISDNKNVTLPFWVIVIFPVIMPLQRMLGVYEQAFGLIKQEPHCTFTLFLKHKKLTRAGKRFKAGRHVDVFTNYAFALAMERTMSPLSRHVPFIHRESSSEAQHSRFEQAA